jgi:hypothetical protein
MSLQDRISPNAYPLTDEEATKIATEAYVYASAIVQMEVHRRVLTNQEVSDGKQMRGPMNQFYHLRNFPDASVREVVGPNFDTLYSFLWYDVSDEPLVISLPESTGRYYLMPILDAWTDVFASPGTRTTGPGAFTFALVGPDWRGTLPEGIEKIQLRISGPIAGPTAQPLGPAVHASRRHGRPEHRHEYPSRPASARHGRSHLLASVWRTLAG